MTKIVCDASSLISLSENCMMNILPELKAEFIIPEGVKKEVVDKPLNVYEFELKALRLRKAIDEGIVKLVKVDDEKMVSDILHEANALFEPKIRILHKGEAECLALMKKVGSKTLLIDERTTRLLVENPKALGTYIRRRTHSKAKLNEKKAREFQKKFSQINIIRSSEVAVFAYEKGLFNDIKDKKLLHACLYALKYSGCAITRKEINQYLKLFSGR